MGFKRDEAVNNANVTNDDNNPSFKYKTDFIADTKANGTINGVKIAVSLKYFGNVWRSLEMLLINCKVDLSLRWIENCVLTTAAIGANANATGCYFIGRRQCKISKLAKELDEEFKRSLYWNKYKMINSKLAMITRANNEKNIRESIDLSYQGVKRLFVLAYNNTAGDDQVSVDSFKKYFLPRVKIKNYNFEIDARNFYDQPINESVKQYDKVRKWSTGQCDDYATGCWLDFAYFEKNYRLIAADLSKQKALDADSRAIQQIIFTGKIKLTLANTKVIICYILEHSQETNLQFSKGIAKVL